MNGHYAFHVWFVAAFAVFVAGFIWAHRK